MRSIVPIAAMNRRLPELGRIRTGAKTEKAMKALSTFRFTSSDRTALEQIAALYGGTVKPWADPKATEGQHEVITEAAEIAVALPADPLGGTPVYELWGGGGCERRCDGVTCETWVKGPDGPEVAEVACICVAKGEMACDPKTRLNVILPNVRGIGTWRLETKSWNAAQELPGMVDLIQSLQSRGITRATLRLEHKRSTQAGQTRKFIVPVLGLDASVEALVAGEATVGRLSAPEIVAASPLSLGGEGGDAADAEEAGTSVPVTAADVHGAEFTESPPPPELVTGELVDPESWLGVQLEKHPPREPVATAGHVPATSDEWRSVCKAFGLTQKAVLARAWELSGRRGDPGSLADLVGHDVAADVAAWVEAQ